MPITRGRRRSDGDCSVENRAGHREIAEEAYRLFVEHGADSRMTSACWRAAEARRSPPAVYRLVVSRSKAPTS